MAQKSNTNEDKIDESLFTKEITYTPNIDQIYSNSFNLNAQTNIDRGNYVQFALPPAIASSPIQNIVQGQPTISRFPQSNWSNYIPVPKSTTTYSTSNVPAQATQPIQSNLICYDHVPQNINQPENPQFQPITQQSIAQRSIAPCSNNSQLPSDNCSIQYVNSQSCSRNAHQSSVNTFSTNEAFRPSPISQCDAPIQMSTSIDHAYTLPSSNTTNYVQSIRFQSNPYASARYPRFQLQPNYAMIPRILQHNQLAPTQRMVNHGQRNYRTQQQTSTPCNNSYQAQQQPLLAALIEGTPAANAIGGSESPGSNINLVPIVSQHPENTVNSHQGASPRQTTTARIECSSQRCPRPRKFRQNGENHVMTGSLALNRESVQPMTYSNLPDPIQSITHINSGDPFQLPISVSSTSRPSIAQSSISLGVQVDPEMKNKACQFDGRSLMINKSLNATMIMVDQSTQTEPVEVTYVDRASSPIIFPANDIPVRRKLTVKKRSLELSCSSKDADQDTEIDVVE